MNGYLARLHGPLLVVQAIPLRHRFDRVCHHAGIQQAKLLLPGKARSLQGGGSASLDTLVFCPGQKESGMPRNPFYQQC
jgi:hypothetical protein